MTRRVVDVTDQETGEATQREGVKPRRIGQFSSTGRGIMTWKPQESEEDTDISSQCDTECRRTSSLW